MKRLIFFLLLSSYQLLLSAQDTALPTPEVFAFVEKTDGKEASPIYLQEQAYLSTDAYKKTKEIFDKLVEARGDFRMRAPKLVLSDAERRVAIAKPRKAEIVLEQKAYEVCLSMGADSLNALAALLSHELVHYYEKHDWTNHFARHHHQMETGAQLQSLDEGLKMETQADYLGGFLAYSAGYQTLEIMPKLLDAIYQAYGLTEQIRGYPSLKERKAIAKQSLQQLQQMIYVFETSNYLIALEQYEAAKTYLDFILKDFQSRELYNNLGVISLHAAMALLNDADLKLIFPFELDGQSRLAKKKKGKSLERQKADDLLSQAILYFEQTNQLDRSYPIALLNLAGTYVLQKKYADASFYLRKAQQLCKTPEWKKTRGDILILEGIIAARQGDEETAISFFKRASITGSDLAKNNLHILDKSPLNQSVDYTINFAKKEPFERYKLDKTVASFLMGNLTLTEIISINKQVQCGIEQQANNTLFAHLVDDKEYAFFLYFHPVQDSEIYQDTPLGTSYDEIIQEYGRQADRRIETSQGSLLVYYKEQILLNMDQKGQLKQIGIFRFQHE